MLSSFLARPSVRLGLGIGGLAAAGVAIASQKPLSAGTAIRTQASHQYLAKSFGIVAFSSAVSAGTAYLLRHTPMTWPKMIGSLVGTVGFSMATFNLDVHSQFAAKSACLTGFAASMGASLAGLSLMFHPAVISSAALGTLGVSAGASLAAYFARDTQQLPFRGFLAGAGVGVSVCGIAGLFYPSMVLHNIWLYGGLAVFSGLMMMNSHRILQHAQTQPYSADYMNDGLGVYTNMYQVFVRLLMIQSNRQRR